MLVAQLAFRFLPACLRAGLVRLWPAAVCSHDLYEGGEELPRRSLLLSAPRLAPPQEGRENAQTLTT